MAWFVLTEPPAALPRHLLYLPVPQASPTWARLAAVTQPRSPGTVLCAVLATAETRV